MTYLRFHAPKRFQTTKISAKCSCSGFSRVEFRLRSPEVERKYSEVEAL